MIGRRISHYRIEEKVGAGGRGEVFRARDLALGREAAVKVLPASCSADLRARLLREAETGARLQHPCIATFFDGGEADGTTFLAMEYVRGSTLRRRLSGGALPPGEACSVAACLLEALAHAHAAGILHRDIKPENIMLTPDRTAKLLDFGLATTAGVETGAGAGPGPFEEARRLLEACAGFDFSYTWFASEEPGLLDLARAAATLGRGREAGDLLRLARDAGSSEASQIEL